MADSRPLMALTLDEAISRWRAAENRLYPVVMVRADLYEQSLRLVRAVADELRPAHSTQDLLQMYDHAGEIAAEAIRRGQLPTGEIDLGLVAAAAFSVRYRELLEELSREEAIQRIREARERGAGWVTLYETGGAGVPPYRRLEMKIPEGAGLHAFIEVDPETGGPLYGVEVIQLDPQTGDWLNDVQPLSARQTFTEPGAWEEAIRRCREL